VEENKMNIIVKKGIVPVHMFDLYGTLVNTGLMSRRSLDAFRELDLPEEQKAKVVSDYEALARGDAWAIVPKVKGKIIKAVKDPLKKAEVIIPYVDGGFYDDGIEALEGIMTAGQQAIVFNTSLDPQVAVDLPNGMGKRMRFYASNVLKTTDSKGDPQSFREVYDREQALGGRVISHSADELPELVAAMQSELFEKGALVFVNRKGKVTPEDIRVAGLEQYVQHVTDLREAQPYTDMVTIE